MADHQPARGAGEAPVGDQRHRLAEAGADDRAGHAEHLAHPRPAARPLVADHRHVARLDRAAGDRGHRVLLAVEDARRAAVVGALVPRHLDHAALRRQVALEYHQPAGRLERVLDGVDDVLAGRLGRRGGLLGERAPGDGALRAVDQAGADQPPRQDGDAARLVDVGGGVAPARLEVGDQRGAAADGVEVVDRQGHAGLARHRQQVQHHVGRAAAGRRGGDAVLECGAGEDLLREDAAPQHVHDRLAGPAADVVLARVDGRDAGGAERREAHHLEDGRHGVGGELPAAGAGAGADHPLQLVQVRVAHLAGGVGADRLEELDDGDVAALEAPRQDRAAVEDHAGDVEADQAHRGARDGLVAGDERHDGVEHVAVADQLDRVGDQLSADEAGLHPFGSHRHAVTDGNGVEFHRRAAGRTDAFLHLHGQVAEMEVARHGLDPGVGHADDRFGEVVVREADGLEHGPCRSAIPAVKQNSAAVSRVKSHDSNACKKLLEVGNTG